MKAAVPNQDDRGRIRDTRPEDREDEPAAVDRDEASILGFHTRRLLAEPVAPDDLGELCRMQRDPRVMATLGDRLFTTEETRVLLDRFLAHWDRHGYGMWVLRHRTTAEFVGRAGLHRCEVEGELEVELAYALRAEFWNQGLTSEVSGEILKRAFDGLGLPSVVAFTVTSNGASQRVLEKLGFELERHFLRARLPHVLYRIRKPRDTARHRATGAE